MNNLLHWHRQRPGLWWLAYTLRHGEMKGVYIINAEAVLQRRRGKGWHALLPSSVAGPVAAIRCRTLHEAADCARRWVEYRGFRVAGQFPEGGGHE